MAANPLPPPPQNADRAARDAYLRTHVAGMYDRLTEGRRRFLRADELCRRAAAEFPGLLPSDAELAAEAPRLQKDKQGAEIAQGLFLSAVLGDPAAGMHLCHGSLLPLPASQARLAEFQRAGALDLGGARVERQGKAAVVTMQNPRFLNAEDESTLVPLETAIDIALLDPQSDICVLRGGVVDHPRYAGKRLFGAGINLTHLYQGKIRYLWYILRDLGLVNKIYRGVALPDVSPEVDCREKLWIGAIEGFAIGGHCQTVLTLDYVLAAADAYMTLPARKEGIIPGAANLRLERYVGARIARQAVLAELRIDCASAEGELICDEIVPPAEMDAAIARTVEKLTGSGVVSAAGNRRAFRIGEEPLDSFRRYMAVYAREQAHCHFSPALIANLERNWNAASRRA
jgi:(3,5-dihydroxyphenyl)acetyl-CoA 1,2-dioxygenase